MAATPSSHARFRALFDQYHDEMSRYCHRRLGPVDANDATADVFVIAWRRLDDVPPGNDARLWLYGVARNVVSGHRRTIARRVRLAGRLEREGTEEPAGPETVVVRNALSEAVLEALDRLEPADRAVLTLKTWEELSHAEIGQVLGVSQHAVDMRINRALGRLRKAMGRSQEGDR